MKIFFVLLSILLGMWTNATPVEISPIVEICDKVVEENVGRCTIEIEAPNGWKFPYPPKIKVQNAKDFSDISQTILSKEKTKYLLQLSAKISNVKTMNLDIESPMCSTNCVFATCSKSVIFEDKNKGSTMSEIFLYIIFGFLGGLLLNIMPCVLPVVLMKLRAFQSKIALIGSICGNFSSFSILIAGLAFLKSVGTLAGWGMHFQSTGFLAVTALILLALTLYSFGIIHFNISMDFENSSKSIFWKNFASSAVATFIAIPCTAPLLGTAAAFAIQGTLLQLVIVFLAIATGFSFPYIFALLFSIKIPHISGRIGAIFDKIVGGGVLITFIWVAWLLFQNLTAAETNFERIYKSIQKDIADNHIVMLNITADWCLTCQYNHKYILGSNEVKQTMSQNNVKFVEVNITKKDDSVTKFLHKHQRVGIPFTIIYGPKAKNGILLDELPSTKQVVQAIKESK